QYPFIWQGGSMNALDLDGADSGNATAINEAGQVVGYTTLNFAGPWGFEVTSAVLWPNARMTYLGSLEGTGTLPHGRQNLGQVVGMSGDPFLWQNGVMTDLTTEFASGGNQVVVQAINDAGQIVGSSGDHAALLQPVASLPSLSINNISVTEGNSGTANAV